MPAACAEAVNVGGTAEVLRLAQACVRLRRFAHISTAYVAGTRTGRILEGPSSRPEDRPSGAHGDVVVVGDKIYIFYFTHPARALQKHPEVVVRR